MKELQKLANMYQQEPEEFMWKCIMNMSRQEEQNLNLEMDEFINS